MVEPCGAYNPLKDDAPHFGIHFCGLPAEHTGPHQCELCKAGFLDYKIGEGFEPLSRDELVDIDRMGPPPPMTSEVAIRRLLATVREGAPRCTGDPCTCTNGIGCVNVPKDQW